MGERGYFVRITPNDNATFDDIIDMMIHMEIEKYFICYEEAARPHYHLCLWTKRSPENLRYQLKERVNGQVYISGKEIQDKVKAIAYCMKDGNYIEKNIDINTFLLAKTITHKKVKFEEELKQIIDNKDLSIRTLVKQIVELHIKYNRKIYRQHIKAMIELIRVKRCPDYKDKLIEYFLEDY